MSRYSKLFLALAVGFLGTGACKSSSYEDPSSSEVVCSGEMQLAGTGISAVINVWPASGNTYSAQVIVTNTGSQPTVNWEVDVQLNNSTMSGSPSNATYTKAGSVLTLRPLAGSNNFVLQPGGQTYLGFSGLWNGSAHPNPTVIAVRRDVGVAGTGGASSGGSGGTVSGGATNRGGSGGTLTGGSTNRGGSSGSAGFGGVGGNGGTAGRAGASGTWATAGTVGSAAGGVATGGTTTIGTSTGGVAMGGSPGATGTGGAASSNVAQDKAATASNSASGDPASYGNDSSPTTSWCASTTALNEWWMVDLGATYSFTGTEVTWPYSGRVYQYTIGISDDGTSFVEVVNQRSNTRTTQIQSDGFSAQGRYLKLTVTGLPASPVTSACISDFKAFGKIVPGSGSGGSPGVGGTTGIAPTNGGTIGVGIGGVLSATGSTKSSGAAGGGSGASSGTSATGGAGLDSEEFFIELPSNLSPEQVALASYGLGGSLVVNDGVSLVGPTSGFANATSVHTTIPTELGVGTEVNNLYSESNVFVRGSHIHGNLMTDGALVPSPQLGSTIDGTTSQHVSLDPVRRLSWTIKFPEDASAFPVGDGESKSIAPGAFGDVTLGQGAHLKLSQSGIYVVNGSLIMEPDSVLEVENSTHPVELYVRGNFIFRGTIQKATPANNFIIGVAGTGDIPIERPFDAILVAPHGNVQLGTSASGHWTSIFAKSILVRPHSRVIQTAFQLDDFCTGGASRLGLCAHNCLADGDCSAGSSCQNGVCGCAANATGQCAAREPCMKASDCQPGLTCGVGQSDRYATPWHNVCLPASCLEKISGAVDCGNVLALCGACPPCKKADGCVPTLYSFSRPDSSSEVAGAIDGTFDVSESGTATYTIPISLPPGRADMTPSLALVYDSSGRQELLAEGWQLTGFSYVTRCISPASPAGRDPNNPKKRRGIRGTKDDQLCLDGQQLVRQATLDGTDGGRGYTTANDSFKRIRAYGREGADAWYFKVWTPEGRILTYGSRTVVEGIPLDANGTVFLDLKTGTARVWALNRIEDQVGNYIEYIYEKNDGGPGSSGEAICETDPTSCATTEIWPKEIRYTGFASTAPTRRVEFAYDVGLPEPVTTYVAGVKVVRNHLLNRINVWIGDTNVTSYLLENVLTDGNVYELKRIWECSNWDTAAGRCKKPTQFTYFGGTGFETAVDSGVSLNPSNESEPDAQFIVWDANGDGLDDLITAQDFNSGAGGQWVQLSTYFGVDNSIKAKASLLPYFQFHGAEEYWQTLWREYHQGNILDVDSDGFDDLVDVSARGQPSGEALKGAGVPGEHVLTSYVDVKEAPDFAFPPLEFPNGSKYQMDGTNVPLRYFIDVEGDGLPDFVAHDPTSGEIKWRRNVGGGLFEHFKFLSGIDAEYMFPIDLDGDGAPDIVTQRAADPFDKTSRVINWDGDVRLPFFDLRSTCCNRSWHIGHIPQDVLPIDVNGDGLKDVLVRGPEDEWNIGAPAQVRLYLSTGNGLKLVDGANFRALAHDQFVSMRVLDYDADGREDALLWTGERWVIFRWSNLSSSGVDWKFREVALTNAPTAPGLFPHRTDFKAVSMVFQYPWSVAADVNGDGALDLVVVDKDKRVRFHLAKTAKTHMLKQVIDGLGEMTEVTYDSGRSGVQEGYTRSSATETHQSTTRVLARVSRPLVSKMSVYRQVSESGGTYDHGSEYHYTDARVDYAGRGWLGFDSKRIVHLNGNNEETEWDYVTYDSNAWIVSPLACTEDKCTDLPSVDEDPWRYPFAGVPTKVETEYNVVPADKEVDGARHITRTVENEWSNVAKSNPVSTTGRRGFLCLRSRTTTERDESVGSGAKKTTISVIEEQFDHDNAGNVNWHEVWTFNGANRVEHTTEESKYVEPDKDRWLLRLPSDVTTTRTRGETVGPNIADFSGDAKARSVHYGYNAQGLLTEVSRGGQPVVTKLTRNAFGNVGRIERSGTDVVTRVTVVDQFDSENIYPVRLTIQPNVAAEVETGELPLVPHTAVLAYDPRYGALTSLTDTNNLTETWNYDGFGRLLRHMLPDGSGETISYSASAMDGSGVLAVPAVFKTTTTLDGGGQSSVEVDSLGRTVRSKALGISKVSSTGAATTTEVVQELSYDYNGRVYQVARPHVTGDNTQGVVTYNYNVLDELTSVVQADGSTVSYDRAEVVSLDPSVAAGLDLEQHDSLVLFRTEMHVDVEAVETRIFDVSGQLTQSIDAEGGTVKYAYDGTGGVLEIDGPHGKTTRSYDEVGRLLSESDPDRGLHEYTYNASDEVRTHTGPGINGSSTRVVDKIGYDPFGRLTKLENADGLRRWQYDQAPTGIGKLSSELVQSAGITKNKVSYAYDASGRLNTISQHALDADHVLSVGYNEYGQVRLIDYPGVGAAAFQVENVFDSQSGQMTEVRDGSSPSNRYWRLAENYQGYLPQVEDIGPVVKTTRQYYAQTGLPKRILSEVSGGAIQDESYEFNRNRNLTSRENTTAAGSKQTFEYDILDRLHIMRDGSGTVTEKIEYDPAGTGNIMSKMGVGTYDYGPAGSLRPHAVKSTSAGRSYEYDDSGNQIARHGGPLGEQTLKYTLFGLPFEIATGTGEAKRITALEYGTNGERLGKHRYRLSNPDDPTSTRIPESLRVYVAGLYELRSNCTGGSDTSCSNPSRTHVYRVYGGGHEVAQVHRDEGAGSTITAQRTYFLHPDQLGSTALITAGDDGATSATAPGIVLRSQQYAPFGKASVLTPGAAAVYTGFTGLEEDADEGLVNANGRIYDPEIGRFLSPDPTTPFAGWTQGHNPYSYALNNPLSWVDPSGFEPEAPGLPEPQLGLPPDAEVKGPGGGAFDRNNPTTWDKGYRQSWYKNHPQGGRFSGKGSHGGGPSKSNGSSGSSSNGGGEATSKPHGDPSQPGSVDNAKGTTPQPSTGASDTGSGKIDSAVDEMKTNAGNKAKTGESSTVSDKGAFIVGMLGFTPPSDNGVSGGIPGGHCEGSRCSSGAGIQGIWMTASLFGGKIVSKAQGMWASVKAGASHASELAAKVADRATERLSGVISKISSRGAGAWAPGTAAWKLGAFKSAAKWEGQLAKRGWTPQQITEAIQKGEKFGAENLVNKGNVATRYVHPKTGQSVVLDEVTKEVIHVGGPGFRY